MSRYLVAVSLVVPLTLSSACDRAPLPNAEPQVESWSALMDDGDPSAIAPLAAKVPPATPSPPRFCPGVTPPGDTSGNFGDCARAPLAFWRFDDCSALSTQLADSSFTSSITHPAFRAVSATCVPGVSGTAIRLSIPDDVVYAPDQPDFNFNRGLTVAGWINPDRLDGVQNIVRKRLDGGSSFVLALDGRRLVFVVRLTDGRLVAATSTVRAGRFTHVAATYDGAQALLYIDGAEVARTRARGTLAAGAGPIFIGNDADGRRLRGVVDEFWLNNLAAPADVISALTCIRRAPLATFTPQTTPPEPAGTTVAFDLAITSQDSASCLVGDFEYFANDIPFGLNVDSFAGVVSIAPGQTAHVPINVTSAPFAQPSSLSFSYQVFGLQSFGFATSAQATYVVARPTGPFSCFGSPPFTSQIFGLPFSPASLPTFAFSAPGLAPPAVTPVTAPDGSLQALQISANPGTSSDPAAAFLGFGLGFANPPCLDARAFTGIQFTVSGDLGTCALAASVVPSEDNAVVNGPFGTCTAAACFPPVSGPLATGVNVVHFADMTGGSPVSALNPAGLNAIQWALNVPTDGVTAPCVASFTISDVSFINDTPPPPAVDFTFDSSVQDWLLGTFDAPGNLGAHPPPGVAPPALTFTPTDGNPAPGALAVLATFTDLDQSVDAIINLPSAVNLLGQTLHARVRLVSGPFPEGGVAFHASSGDSFLFAGAPFLGADALPLGVWVPLDFDLANPGFVTDGFDPSQIVQIGFQFFSGFSGNGTVFSGGGETVLEIDTVTD